MWRGRFHNSARPQFLASLCLVIGLAVAAKVATSWLSQPPADDPGAVPEALLPPATPRLIAIRKNGTLIRPLHARMGKIQPGDWLEKYTEPGQTFDQYLFDHREPVHVRFDTMYVQPLGELTATQRRLLDDTVDFLDRFFEFPVKLQMPISLDDVPASARRPGASESAADEQFLTTYLLDHVLAPHVPDDAVAVLGLSMHDLWAGENWNYVFGQASLTNRVGVWSIHRFGSPEAGDAEYAICLRRTLATAAHETGHMLGILHCTAYECCMNGSNNLAENDRRPLEFCPECQQKICWACGIDPAARYARLAEFADSYGLKSEGQYWRSAMKCVPTELMRRNE